MAIQRSPSTRHDTSQHRKYHLRRSPTSRRLLRIESTPELGPARPVLVPLHTNLRRRPSRPHPSEKLQDGAMPPVQLGSKRKRVASSNENAHGGGRPTRGSGRLKRLRSDAYDPSDAGEASGMDVDDSLPSTRWLAPNSDDDSDGPLTEPSEDEDDAESTDDHLINVASAKELQRLRKEHLVRLYISAGLSDEADTLTKTEIVDSIVSARDDVADLPPSSPRGASSDEHENDADEDEVHTPTPAVRSRYTNGLRRRATVNETDAMRPRPSKGRSLSMGHMLASAAAVDASNIASGSNLNGTSVSSPQRRKPSRALATAPTFRTSFPPLQPPTLAVTSPPATRLRSRKTSGPSFSLSAPLSSASASPPAMYTNGFPFPDTTTQRGTAAAKGRGKGKAKQVEFTGDLTARAAEREKEREQARRALADESDLTELDDDEEGAGPGDPSPRRLRSKDKERERLGNGTVNGKGKENLAVKMVLDSRRVTPMRRAKKGACAPEDEEEEEEVAARMEESEADDDEQDQLATPTRNRHPRWGQRQRQLSPLEEAQRTPLARRLRPRTRRSGSVEPPPNEADGDGDDEQEDDEDEESTVDGDDEDVGAEEDEDEEQTIAVEPRKLRNGKIVGDDMEVEEEGEEEEEEELDEDGEEAVDEVDEDAEEAEEDAEEADEDVEVDEVEVDAEGDAEGETDEDPEAETEEDEPMEDDDVDLTIATAKTLVRLRRDDLVRLCETRDLEAVGTKPQLAEALLQWRDRHADASSPSSAGTVTGRPPSTVVKGRRRNHSQLETPILLRSHHVHIDEPITPEPKEAPVGEPELELDLESLGLEDREIPPDKLQKLEKIGSGGFKDVFIGKFRGRRIAISEFRGQLSAMDIKELKLLGGFDHPNIVRFLGVSIPENTRETPVMIVSELCSNGDLFDYVRNVTAPTLSKVLTMMLDIARGLEYLHQRRPSVIHRDCKSSNILITARGTAKIADFGLAKVKQSTRSMVRSLVGTVNWQAPELWHAHPKYNHKVDVFSCAMVYWEMLQWNAKEKKFPWEGMNEHAIYEVVGAKKQRPSTANLRKQWSSAIVDLIERMWAHEHQERPTMSEVVKALEEMTLKK